MKGPKSEHAAMAWVKEAVREYRYLRTRHLFDRMKGRAVSRFDVLSAIRHASHIEPYGAAPEHGGTCWRVHGKDSNGRRLAIGVEAYLDENQKWAVLVTVIESEKGKS